MDVIYKVTYLPHIGTNYPKYYIGSKKNWKPGSSYRGSCASRQIFEFTNGLELRVWYKNEVKSNISNFLIEILESYDNASNSFLLQRELENHKKYNVLNEDYFNQTMATLKFCSLPNTDLTKQKKSEATKKYWNSPKGIEKRKRLSERNRKTKSIEMQNKWDNPTPAMINRNISGRPLGAKDLNGRKKKKVLRVYAEGKIFDNAESAAIYYGIHQNNIRRKCRLDQYADFYYIE
jgi:hypothetical protein